MNVHNCKYIGTGTDKNWSGVKFRHFKKILKGNKFHFQENQFCRKNVWKRSDFERTVSYDFPLRSYC